MKIKGLTSVLDRVNLRQFLRCVLKDYNKAYVLYSMLSDELNGSIVPNMELGKNIDIETLLNNQSLNIWELCVSFYSSDYMVQPFKTYDEFLSSTCNCCVIFYDCSELEIYIKDTSHIDKIKHILSDLGAEDIAVIDESNHFRTIMCG